MSDSIIVSKENGELLFHWKGQKITIAQELYKLIKEDIVEKGDRIYTKSHVQFIKETTKVYQSICVVLPHKQ
jgi:hypothetical protein